MEILVNILYYVIPFIVLLGILVFVHEFGHFLMARLSGVEVSTFSIGFGKELWGYKDKRNTYWKICVIPLGGYCQFLGDDDASSVTSKKKKLTKAEQKKAFAFQNPFKKLLIVLAGPGFNYLFAVLLYVCLFMALGRFTYPPVVGEVMPEGAAAQAGIVKGDRILSINGVSIANFSDISREVALAADRFVHVEVLRGDQNLVFEFPLTEIEIEQRNGKMIKQYMLGVRSVSCIEAGYEKVGFFKAIYLSFQEVGDVTTATLRGVGQMIMGKRSTEDVGGIIRIAEMSGDISKGERIWDFLVFMALLSVNLGLINLFPIPVLDGGHIVIFVLEIITRRPIHEKVKEWLFKLGFILLVALMLLATWNDIVHLINRWFNF